MAKLILWACLSILVWDFFNSEPGESAAFRVMIEFYDRLESKGVVQGTFQSVLEFASSAIPSSGRASAPDGIGPEEYARIAKQRVILPQTPAMPALDGLPSLVAVPDEYRGAIWAAHVTTGMSLSYLVGTAKRESNFNPIAINSKSSATGMYQFIEQTWLEILDRKGAKYGYAKEAGLIRRTADGRYRVSSASDKDRILNLRYNSTLSTLMAAELARLNEAALKRRFNRAIADHELYLAHFLGLNGAVKMIETIAANPGTIAADLFPKAARANRNVFYASRGKARSVRDVYTYLKLDDLVPLA